MRDGTLGGEGRVVGCRWENDFRMDTVRMWTGCTAPESEQEVLAGILWTNGGKFRVP